MPVKAAAWVQAIATVLYLVATIVMLSIINRQTADIHVQTAVVQAQQKFVLEQQAFARKQEARWRLEARRNEFDSPEMLQVRAAACHEYGQASPQVLAVFNIFEKAGGDLRRGYASIDDVDYFLREPALLYWFAWHDWAVAMRMHEADPELFKDYEYLVHELTLKTSARQPPEAQLRAWAADEIDGMKRMAAMRRTPAKE
jgi:hypothetical protein